MCTPFTVSYEEASEVINHAKVHIASASRGHGCNKSLKYHVGNRCYVVTVQEFEEAVDRVFFEDIKKAVDYYNRIEI